MRPFDWFILALGYLAGCTYLALSAPLRRFIPYLLTLGALAAGVLYAGEAQARDAAQVRAFRRHNPCPATDRATGACPGWVVDHVIPLCAGGRDAPDNMAWQEYAASLHKDRDERALCRRIATMRLTACRGP